MNAVIVEFSKGFREFGEDISSIIISTLLSFVYFLGIGITSILMKLAGKRFLEKEFPAKTYWTNIQQNKAKKEGHYRQF